MHVSSHNRRVSGIIKNLASIFSFYCLFIYRVIIIALFMSIMNIHNVLITLSHGIPQLIVVYLYVVVIIILLLINQTYKLNF